MRSIESMKIRIGSTQKLLSVVKTMKSLAAVNIRQYEQAVESVAGYAETVEMGLQVVMRHRDDLLVGARLAPRQSLGAVVIGSDVGMCGSLNDQVVTFSLASMKDYLGLEPQKRPLLAVGEKVAALLDDEGLPVQRVFRVPGSIRGITGIVEEILLDIDAWRRDQCLAQVFLFFSQQESGMSSRPRLFKLLPEDQEWLQKLRQKSWSGPSLPIYTMAWDPLFSALIRQYLFISLFRSLAHSLASENAGRLAAMQRAEKNIEEKLGVLNSEFHQQRQTVITEELLDIISGYESLKNERHTNETQIFS